jgi:hypothetical protein
MHKTISDAIAAQRMIAILQIVGADGNKGNCMYVKPGLICLHPFAKYPARGQTTNAREEERKSRHDIDPTI